MTFYLQVRCIFVASILLAAALSLPCFHYFNLYVHRTHVSDSAVYVTIFIRACKCRTHSDFGSGNEKYIT